MGKVIKKPFRSFPCLILVLALVLSCLPGCFDLGMFEDGEEEGYADYYAAFGDVYTLSEDGTHHYDLKDSLFNKTTINDLTWEDVGDAVSVEPYTFIAIPCDKDMNLEIVSFYLKGDVDTDLEVFVYRMDGLSSVPSSLLFYDDAGEEDEEEDEEDDEEKQDPAVSILSLEEAECSVIWHTSKDQFSSVSVSLKKEGKGLPMEEGQILLLYITNNTRFGCLSGKQRCGFTFLNLLIRAVE